MKKICFLCPKAYPLFNDKISAPFGGGTEVQLYLLAREFSSYPDVKVSFIVADNGQLEKETYGNIDIFRSFRFKDTTLNKTIKFYKAMRTVDADIYIQSTLTLFSGIIALLCRLSGKKIIYRCASDYEVDGRYEKEKGTFISYFSKLVFKYAHLVIVQNTGQQEALQRREVKNTFLLRNGIAINSSAVDKEDFVLWVGRSVKTKKPELLIDLAKQMPQIKFVMISSGSSNNELHQRMKSQSKAVPNLMFHDSLSFNETNEYFQKAKIFISTSDMEGFPMVFLQAAASKTPIISLYVDLDSIFSEKKCGLFSRGDFSLFKEQVNELLQDGKLNQELGKNGYGFTQKNCSITHIAKQLAERIINF